MVAMVAAVLLTVAAPGEVRLDAPLIKQERQACGAASLAMVLEFWRAEAAKSGSALAEEIYAELRAGESGGVRLADMKSYLTGRGFHAFTVRGSGGLLEEHVGKGRPVIVGLRHGPKRDLHFVVVTGFNGRSFWVNDPARKRPQSVKKEKFEGWWKAGDGWTLIAVPKSP